MPEDLRGKEREGKKIAYVASWSLRQRTAITAFDSLTSVNARAPKSRALSRWRMDTEILMAETLEGVRFCKGEGVDEAARRVPTLPMPAS